MNVADLVDAFGLPEDARVGQRVPKKLLIENGAPIAADKRAISEGIEAIQWVAALKPGTIGVPAYRDTLREYLEVSVLTMTLRATGKAKRLTELVHRAIPYPVLLLTAQGEGVSLSLAHKRWSQGEADKVVIEDICRTIAFGLDGASPHEASFVASLALAGLPARNLFDLYQGWIDRVVALEAADIIGTFSVSGSAERAAACRDALVTYTELQREISRLRAQAAREKQINRLVEINLDVKRLESELAVVRQSLAVEAS